ncbi:MAG TPA: DUF192 domain-containing protein [Bryobacteraceae bacterium]|nr:DUF192 domain-containing protein [Bryobacteraceae bacterium]
MRFVLLASLALFLISCGSDTGVADPNTREITLPNGKRIQAEIMRTPDEMMRGMMFRDSLAPDRGMLFVHQQPGNYPYWMYQVRIPLDIMWLDRDHNIVEISAGTPPCKGAASQCPNYGGHARAQFVVELAGGRAAANGLKLGDHLQF